MGRSKLFKTPKGNDKRMTTITRAHQKCLSCDLGKRPHTVECKANATNTC